MPSLFDVGSLASDLVDSIGDAADGLFTSDEERKRAELAVRSRLLDHKEKMAAERAETIRTETQGAWYQRAWRPAMMALFGCVIAAHWWGLAGEGVTPEVQRYLYSIIKLGLGGYVVGRSAEKIAPSLSDALRNRK